MDNEDYLPDPLLFRIPRVESEPEYPFSKDKFDRKNEADFLISILDRVTVPSVIVIDAPFGFGKSYFLKETEALMKTKGDKTVFFDAWENDNSNDPYVSFAQHTIEALKESKSSSLEKSAKKIATYTAKAGTVAAIGALTKALIGDNAAKKLSDLNFSEDDFSDFTKALGDKTFSTIQQEKSAKVDFQIHLAKSIKKTDKSRLVFFIDELDRCRPDFALELLENIKHLFSVKGAIFIIAANVQQISKFVETRYGSVSSGEPYLRRFFDWTYKLKPPNHANYISFICSDVLGLGDKFESGPDRWPLDYKLSLDMFTIVAEAYKLSARDIDQISVSTLLAIDGKMTQPNAISFVMHTIKYSDPAFYEELKNFSTNPINKPILAVEFMNKVLSLPEQRWNSINHLNRDYFFIYFLVGLSAIIYPRRGEAKRVIMIEDFSIFPSVSRKKITETIPHFKNGWGEITSLLSEHTF